ncbi:high mobility group protein Z [Serratia sp. MYb239]|uniref:High mobility group protein Z n=1 Tax=Serratia rhizosphaerae TaxID=2597702 RepID=A0ABX6GM05_9GAMM|nr:high mobility group protein Z [Serratia sp. MYb239]QHA87298.1 high mobility group protein Z [Serratia rhizosphaerae]
MWPILLIALLLTCYLLWLFGKLWRLSRRKARLRSASVARQQRQLPISRPGRKRKPKGF